MIARIVFVLGHSLAICQLVLVSDPLAAVLLVLFGAPRFVVASPSIVCAVFVVLLTPQTRKQCVY